MSMDNNQPPPAGMNSLYTDPDDARPPVAATTAVAVTTSLPPASASSMPRNDSLSESSDDGIRLSAAAARRFARRNLRRTSPTPDLVTSLVRPPSPEAFYVAPQIHNRVRADIRARIEREASMASASGGAARRVGPRMVPHLSSLDIPKRYGGERVFDLYASIYVNDVDPNLACPICHDPLVDPVATPCDHIFCYRCLRRSLTSSPSGMVCPIDREPLQWTECTSVPRLIRTQLNSLLVKCPNHGRGCTSQLRREHVEAHARSECRFKEFVCPGKNCDKRLGYKPIAEACQHHDVQCGLCETTIVEADTDLHLLSCRMSKTRCESCWNLVTRSQLQIHHDYDCEGVEVGCLYQDIGCPVKVTRGQLGAHALSCAFHPDTPSGAVIRAQRDVIDDHADLAKQLRDLQKRQDDVERQTANASSSSTTPLNGTSAVIDDHRTMQDFESGFEEVHKSLTQIEARQSMWTMTQVMPIRDEVTELRNTMNMLRMHVNWLLNRSREEGRIRAANVNNSAASGVVRRNSAGEAAPSMPQRRTSGNEMDLPRL